MRYECRALTYLPSVKQTEEELALIAESRWLADQERESAGLPSRNYPRPPLREWGQWWPRKAEIVNGIRLRLENLDRILFDLSEIGKRYTIQGDKYWITFDILPFCIEKNNPDRSTETLALAFARAKFADHGLPFLIGRGLSKKSKLRQYSKYSEARTDEMSNDDLVKNILGL